jgi:hypothetical protein
MLVSTMLGQLGDSTGIIVEPTIDVGTTRDGRRLEMSTVLVSTNARDTRRDERLVSSRLFIDGCQTQIARVTTTRATPSSLADRLPSCHWTCSRYPRAWKGWILDNAGRRAALSSAVHRSRGSMRQGYSRGMAQGQDGMTLENERDWGGP